jgi:UDP-glucuronate decarboxylase
MKNVVVTGGAGFIGGHLVETLLNKGYKVVVFDNFLTGTPKNLDLENPNLFLVEHDVVDRFDSNIKELIKETLDGQVDEIYNLACPASPVHYQADPIYTTMVSVAGMLNTLELARTYNSKILQASTSEVYGDPHVHPQPESYWGNVNPHGIRSCYDEGKRCAESLCFDYHRQHQTLIKVVRIFNTYGPRMLPDDGRVVSNFCVQAAKSKPLTIYGSGSQTRSFCYVTDLVDGLIRMMENTPDSFLGPINLGNPDEFTILQLAQKVQKLAQTYQLPPTAIQFEPLPGDDPKQRRPDITLAQQVLGWTPKVKLEEGLRITFEYFLNITKENSKQI